MDKINALRSLFIFKDLDYDSLDSKYSITESSPVKHYSDSEIIMNADYTEGLPVLLSGRAKIYSGECPRNALLKVIEEGECFGAATILSSESDHSTVVKSSGQSATVTIPIELLNEILHREPECSFRYITFLSDKISFLNKKITAFTAGSAESRLAVYLSGLDADDSGRLTLPVSLSELSSRLGIGRASLYRALDSFEENGIISRKSKSVTLLCPEKLRSMIQ